MKCVCACLFAAVVAHLFVFVVVVAAVVAVAAKKSALPQHRSNSGSRNSKQLQPL